MIDEHEWRSVLQVAKDGTFSAAAKHLYISQPSLSQCIKKVETELGVRLFDRSQTPLALTTAGEIYVRQAKEILRIRQALVQEVADLRIAHGQPDDRQLAHAFGLFPHRPARRLPPPISGYPASHQRGARADARGVRCCRNR